MRRSLQRDAYDRGRPLLLRSLAEGGTTVLVSSHVMDEAAHCDELLLLREGQLLATGPVAEILARTGAPNLDEAFLRLVEEAA